MSIIEKDNKDKELSKKLDKVLDKNKCQGEDCYINDPEELLVKKENRRIITNDGRELLSEYTTR